MALRTEEKSDIIIKPEYAYGNQGNPPNIPAKATLIYTIELIEINERKPNGEPVRNPS